VKTGVAEAVVLSLVMGLVILFCRAFPFLFFRGRSSPPPGLPGKNPGGLSPVERFLAFVEKAAPPAAMTVLAFNAIAGQVRADLRAGAGPGVPALAAAVLTALLHLRGRNPLISIFGGTAAFMILEYFW
jgi:branched-subunit amino acid transport protein AzlD